MDFPLLTDSLIELYGGFQGRMGSLEMVTWSSFKHLLLALLYHEHILTGWYISCITTAVLHTQNKNH